MKECILSWYSLRIAPKAWCCLIFYWYLHATWISVSVSHISAYIWNISHILGSGIWWCNDVCNVELIYQATNQLYLIEMCWLSVFHEQWSPEWLNSHRKLFCLDRRILILRRIPKPWYWRLPPTSTSISWNNKDALNKFKNKTFLINYTVLQSHNKHCFLQH